MESWSDTRVGFPSTSQTLVEAITSADQETRSRALELLVEAYWRPVYGYLRRHWRLDTEDAEDLTQEFFARLLEKELLAGYDAGKARFRTYLRVCVDGFAANQRKASGRLKRGGGTPLLSLDFVDAEGELRTHDAADPYDPEAEFRAAWIRSLFTGAVKQLELEFRAAGKERSFDIFERYDLTDRPAGERVTYAALAGELGLPATQVNNHLAAARRRFREIVVQRLRSVCATDAEFRTEARELFGWDEP
jgi:RNA polymerase sigma factor (sigma-70 family)